MANNKTQIRVDVVGDGTGVQKTFKDTELAATQFEAKLAGVQAQLLKLGSSASGLNLGALGGVAGQAGGVLGNLTGLLGGAEGGAAAAGLGVATVATGGLVVALGGLVTAGTAGAAAVTTLAGETRKLAMQTGLTAEEASGFLAVFKRFGIDGQEASQELIRFSRNLAGVTDASEEAATGGKTASAVMADLGVQARDAAGNIRPMDDLLFDLADKFQQMPNGAQKTADAVALFGRSGATLLPVLNQGSAGIKDLMERAKELGLTLTSDNIASVKQYTLAHKDLNEALEGLRLQIGVAVMPLLVELAKVGDHLATGLNENLIPAIRDETGAFGTLKAIIGDANKSMEDFGKSDLNLEQKFLQWFHDIPNTRSADDPVEKFLNARLADYQHAIDAANERMADKTKETANAAADGLGDPAAQTKAAGYGSALLESYLQGMTTESLTIFDSLKKTLEDGLKAASPDGKVDPATLRNLLPPLAELATEIERNGTVSDATWAKVAAALGGEGPLVRALVGDYERLAAAKQEAASANQALASAQATLTEDTKAAAGEAASYTAQINTARAAQTAHDKEGAAAVKGLESNLKGLRGEAQQAADAGNAALSGLNANLHAAQDAAASSAAAYQAQNDAIQHQIDLNNQVVSQLEHQRDVKFLAIDERLAELRGSKDAADRHEAATLRRDRARIERDSKPQIDLERERAQVANYGLTQQQQGIQAAAKEDAARNAANLTAIQNQIIAQQNANKTIADGFTARENAIQTQIDNQNTANQNRHDGDQAAIDALQTLADNSAAYWAARLTSDQAAVDSAKQLADYYKAVETSAANALASDQKRIAELAAAGLLTTAVPTIPGTRGGTQGDDNGQNDGAPTTPTGGAVGGGRDARMTSLDFDGGPPSPRSAPPPAPRPATHQEIDEHGQIWDVPDGRTLPIPGQRTAPTLPVAPPQLGPPAPGIGAVGRGAFNDAANTYHINMYGVGEADLLDRIARTIQEIAAT